MTFNVAEERWVREVSTKTPISIESTSLFNDSLDDVSDPITIVKVHNISMCFYWYTENLVYIKYLQKSGL